MTSVRSFPLGRWSCLWGVVVLCHVAAAWAQTVEQGVPIVAESISNRVDGFSYRPDTSSDLEFRGTGLAPHAAGSAKVHTATEHTEIASRFEHLPAASSLGPFATYVLWLVTPEGQSHNLGAIELDGEKGRLSTTTPLSSFALIVTAEPHFAVSIPSKYIVLQSVGSNVQGTALVVTSLAARANYEKLQPWAVDPKHPMPVELIMAHYAVSIAEAAEAPKLASKSYERAKSSLNAADQAQSSKKSADRSRVPELSREAIQAAEDSRVAAETRHSSSEVETLRSEISDRDAKLQAAEQRETEAHQKATALESRIRTVESHLPSAASRQQFAAQLLGRWLVMQNSERALTAHITSDEGFVKGRIELTPVARERVSVAAGILLGIGNVTVKVTPALQLNDDVKQLELSQHRARAVMEWLASLGLNAVAGEPDPSSAAAERALAPGPGVDLVIAFEGPEGALAASAAR